MLNVQVVLFDGFDLLDAIAPYEVFCAAAMNTEDKVHVELVTAEGPRTVASGTNGLKIEASGRLAPSQTGVIIVPGASGKIKGDGQDSIPVILNRAMNTSLTGLIEQALQNKDLVVATVCGGSLLLAMGGLLEGRPAVTNHLGMEVLGATGAVAIQARVVDAGNFVSGGGVTSGLDVALYLVERELGPRIAHAVEQLFEFERRGTVWREVGLEPVVEENTASSELSALSNKAVSNEDSVTSKNAQTLNFDGEWDTTIVTPVGKLQVKLSISTLNGVIQGTANQGDETVQFLNPILDNNVLTWSLPIKKPMRLNLKFEVVINGNSMTGTAKAGMLPASKLTGQRIS